MEKIMKKIMNKIKIVSEIFLKGIALLILCLPLILTKILWGIGDAITSLSDRAADSICESTSKLWEDIEELKELL